MDRASFFSRAPCSRTQLIAAWGRIATSTRSHWGRVSSSRGLHNDPSHALCDGPQSLRPEDFDHLAKKLLPLHSFVAGMEG